MSDSRLHRLTINFLLLAFAASSLLGLGQRATTMPTLIGLGLVLSYVLTDRLQIFVLPRLAGYLAMLGGAMIAIAEWLLTKKIDQLHAVANLLIYVQFGLMFQQKDRRVFEQWGIFLLLELIVAALVNDNLLYGVLLIPVLLLGCSTLLSYASYVSNSKGGQSGFESNSLFFRIMKWFGRDAELRPPRGTIKLKAVTNASGDENLAGTWIGIRRTLVFVLNILLFATAFFYIMPRLQSGAYEGAGMAKPVVGFSGEVTLEHVGQLLETNAAALKIRFISVFDGKELRPIEPPYIRGAVCHVYTGSGRWENIDRENVPSEIVVETPSTTEIKPEMLSGTDGIEIDVEEQTYFENATFSIPPFSKPDSRSASHNVLATDWTILDEDRRTRSRVKQKYRFRSYSFKSGVQSRILPVMSDCLRSDVVNQSSLQRASLNRYQILADFDHQLFPGVVALRDQILANETSKSLAEQVLALEDYLVSSPDFTYSLRPSPYRQPDVDPIEDFATNHKSGHCQYFASTLAMMLRSMHVPARVVLGFRPSDFNSTGMYFVVRQRHAHTWVEAFLTREQLQEAGLEIPVGVTYGAWLRLDPTPAGEGSNAGGSIRSRMGQLETLQQLWQDYVMGVDSSDQPQMLQLFDAKDQGLYGQFKMSLERMMFALQNNQLVGGVLTPTKWFSFGGAFAIISLVVLLVALYRLVVFTLKYFSKIDRKRRAADLQRLTQIKFYRRVISALAKFQLRRKPNQTPLEFAQEVEAFFAERRESLGNVQPQVQFLTSIYYRIRFGFEAAVQESEWQKIEAATVALERLAETRPRHLGKVSIS